MTGGSAAGNVGILSRANEIIRLRQREKALEKEIEELVKKHREAERELNSAIYEMETAQGEYRRLQDEVLKLEAEISQRKILIESLENSYRTYEQIKIQLAGKLRNVEGEISEAEAVIKENREKSKARRAQAERISQGQEELHKKLEALNALLSQLKQEEASLNAEKEAILRAISEWEQLLEEFSQESEQKTVAIAALNEKNQIIRSRIEENHSKAIELRNRTEEKKKILSDKINEKLQIEAKRSASDKKAQELSREIMELEREHSRLEQKILTAELEEKQIIDKLWDTYELSRSAAQRIRLELDSVSKAQKQAAELKREISKLGTPNLGAIEEFERVNGRYTYLTEQRDDIQKAKTEIEKIIRDVTDEMKTIFAREFSVINESFKETFTELFGGGKADLILEDENDILNCGIEIMAQPPGKTQRALSLLSGGEKAIVAIAIHFAILKVRPTPFCVFDEIETALDEKNVERFAKYLRKMSEKTQFLIITHRRGTMEEADVLYGVTMQRGVSKVLSIDLEKALEEAK
jgi:chromosome segregation protein